MRAPARVLALALLLVASQAALAQGNSVLGADTVLATITQAMKPAFSKLSVQATSWLAALATLQYIITNHKLLLGDGDLQSAFAKLVGHVAWVGVCLYIMNKAPDFISAVGDQMFGIVTEMPTPGSIMGNTFGLAAIVGTLAVGVGAIPLVGGTAGNIVVIVMLLVLAVGMYFALKIFLLQLELGLIVMMSPLSFALLGLNALRDQGIAPFKSLLALAYRIVLVGVILTAFSSVSDALTSTLKDITVQQIITDGLGSVIDVIVQAVGAYVLLAFLLFKSDSIASSLASGTASLSSSDMTAAAAAGAAAGAVAATGGAAAAATAGKAPKSMASFMGSLMGGGGSISNASSMGSGGDVPPFIPPPASPATASPALSVGAPVTEGAPASSSPSRPQSEAASRPARVSVASGRYGADLSGAGRGLNDGPGSPSAEKGAATGEAAGAGAAATDSVTVTPAGSQGKAGDATKAVPAARMPAISKGDAAAGATDVSVGGPTADGATSMPPSRPQTETTSSPSKANVASGRYGAAPREISQKESAGAGEAQAPGSADGAAIGGQPSQAGSTKLEEKLEKLVDHLSQPNKPSAGQQLRELDQRLAHDKATVGVSINPHHD